MEQINLNTYQFTCILNRFNNKFIYRKYPYKNKKLNTFYENGNGNAIIINIYKKKCTYTKDFHSNYYKDHLIIKYKKQDETDNTVICLNIVLDDYKDLLV
jgi:hypothetical protein